jgi:hypothetical protein
VAFAGGLLGIKPVLQMDGEGHLIKVATAGADHNGRPLGLLAEFDLTVQNIAFQRGFFVAGNGDMNHLHGSALLHNVFISIAQEKGGMQWKSGVSLQKMYPACCDWRKGLLWQT